MILDKILSPKHIEAMHLAGMPLTITFLSLGLIWMLVSSIFYFSFITTQATVVDYEVSQNSEGEKSYSAVVNYTMKNGSQRRSVLTMSSNNKKYSLASQLTILYKPTSPKLVFIKSFEGLFLAPLILIIAGLLSAITARHYKNIYHKLKEEQLKEAANA